MTIANARVEAQNNTNTYPIQLVDIRLGQGSDINRISVNTGYRNVSVNSVTYQAVGNILTISALDQTSDIQTSALNLRLSGLDSNVVAEFYDDVSGIGGVVQIRQAYMNDETGNIVPDSDFIKWEGIVNSVSTEEDNQRGEITVTVECKSKVGALLNVSGGRYTSQSSFRSIENSAQTNTQRANDRSMEFVSRMVNFNPQFGRED